MGRHRPYKERKFTVGQRLLTLRTRAKLTQTDLAALVGVNRRSLQNWESGAGYPKEDALQRLIAVFLAQGVFTPGQEREEAAQLWELVSQDAPRPLALFDPAWFTSLLAARPVPPAAGAAPVAPADASPSALPTGLVTFLATDIEGSTTRWEHAPQAMQQALTRHHAILRQLTALYHGQVFHTAGDSFICVFDDAPAALQSAVAVQRALLAEPWPEVIAPLRVRMALHSGAATASSEGYIAEPTLNRLSRVLAASQGGQIVLTQAVVDLIGEAWPDGVTRNDLGVQQLRDVTVPLQLWQALAPDLPTDIPALRLARAATPHVVDWGEAIDVPILYGRETEFATLEQWVLTDRCRVVALLGLGGIGKTSLAITFAHRMGSDFDTVVFRSLRNAPSPGSLLDTLIPVVSAQQATSPEHVADKITRLVELLRTRHCLLVLDNLEAILQAGAPSGDYRAGYADYGELIRRLGEAQHQSCLLLTSREKPGELGPLEGRTAPVRTLLLGSLPESACRTILEEKDVSSSDAEIAALAQLYGGNPLALKLVSEPIRELFGGDVGAFLAAGDAFFNGVGKLLSQQFARSAPLEQALLYWLAIERDLVPLDGLLTDLTGVAGQREVLMALESLRRRLLIQRGAGRPAFTLQPVILEYLTDRLVREVCREIVDGQPMLLRSHALVQATGKDYVRRSQERLIGQTVLEQVVATYGGAEETEQQLRVLLQRWRGQPHAVQGYGPGNVVNLLRLLRGNLRGLNLSQLAIRQAYLQEGGAQDTSLVGSQLFQPMLIEPFAGILCLASSADGQVLVVGTETGQVRLWRVTDRALLLSIQAHTGTVMTVAISTDGRRVASGGHDGIVRVWDGTSGAGLAALSGHPSVVRGVSLSADGRVLASGGQDGTVRWWEPLNAEPTCSRAAGTGWVNCVTLSADGQLLASGSQDGTVRLWEVSSGTCLTTLQGHTDAVFTVALTASAQLLASGSQDGTVRLWEVSSGTCLATLQGHSEAVTCITLSPDGQLLVSGSRDGTVRLWEVSSGTCLTTLQGHTGPVLGVALVADGQLLASGSMDGTVRLWEVSSGTCLTTLQGYTSAIYSVALTADGQLLTSGSVDGIVRLWETAHGRLLTTLSGHTGLVWGVTLTVDGRIVASGSEDRTVRLWDVGSGMCLATLQGHAGGVYGVAFSPDGRLLATGSFDGTVRLWDVDSGTCLATLQGHTNGAYSVAFSADGQVLASSGGDGTVRLWDVGSGTCLVTLQANTNAVFHVALSSDGQLLACGSFDGTVRLWDVGSGTCLATLQGHTGAVFDVALTADEQMLASSSLDGTVRLWEVSSGTCLATLQGHSGAVMSITLSPNGQLLASGSQDGTVRLWEARSWTTVQELRPDRPYERMDITGLTGVTEAQRAALKALGAVERSESATAPTSD